VRALTITLFLAILVCIGIKDHRVVEKTIPEKIVSSIVAVENSTGVVIHSDGETTLVLTAFHVIEDKIDKETNTAIIRTSYLVYRYNRILVYKYFLAYQILANPSLDLALIEIKTNQVLDYSKVVKHYNDPKLGEGIWTASNPNYNYRSLRKTEVGSKTRPYILPGRLAWEIGGGVLFGSSGGGVFSQNGKLSGIIVAVESFMTNDCWVNEDQQADGTIREIDECQSIPIPYLGFSVSPKDIRIFLLSHERYAKYFEYLR